MNEALVTQPVPEFRLIARDPQELEASRQQLVTFFSAKLQALDAEAKGLEENLAIALKFPIRTQPIKAALNRIERQRLYYEKAKAAVEAGFHLIPNFDADIFAIRTRRSARGQSDMTSTSEWAINSMPVQRSQALPVGEGRYVSPTPVGVAHPHTETKDGKPVTRYFADVTDFAGIDFPFSLARPEVLSATKQVLADKIFDELGALPRSQRNADPMVVGIIKEQGGRAWRARRMTFLVVWFLDTATL